MDRNKQDIRYEELYNRLLERGIALHENNKKRIRAGLIFLAVFTVLMILIRYITDSDRVVFMILWVVGMFAASIYLISVEYIDDSIQKTLEEVSEREADFGELLPDSSQMRERVQSRIQEKHEEIQALYKELRRAKTPEREDEK
jgi:beta-lactamase regulating signal transducer with metallopeptidase domain